MKNNSMPMLNEKLMRRNGSASAFTSPRGVDEIEQRGRAKYPIGPITANIASAVRNACCTMRLTRSESPAPT